MAHHHTPRSSATLKERSVTALSLLLLSGLIAAAGVIMGYYFIGNHDLLLTRGQPDTPGRERIQVTLSGRQFLVPAYMLVNVRRSALLRVKRIALQIPLPYTPGRDAVTLKDQPDMNSWVFAILERRAIGMTNRQWLDKIYRHYAAAPATIAQNGLYHYRFKARSPYGSIELFTDSLENPQFFIRCELLPSTFKIRFCERTMPLPSGLAVHYRFSRQHLDEWQKMHNTIIAVMNTITPR